MGVAAVAMLPVVAVVVVVGHKGLRTGHLWNMNTTNSKAVSVRRWGLGGLDGVAGTQ